MTDNEQKWVLNIDYATRSLFKKFNKKHPREYKSCFANLDKIKGLLENGNRIGEFKLGFFRSERDGLYRVGQSKVAGAKEARLYVYPSEKEKTIYILRIGTKESQQRDIRESKKLITKIREEG